MSLLRLILLAEHFPLLLIVPKLCPTLVSCVLVSQPLQLQYVLVVQRLLLRFFPFASDLLLQAASGGHPLPELAFVASLPLVRLPLASHAPPVQAFFIFPTHQIPALVSLLLA